MIPNSRGRIERILSILEIAKNIEELDVPTYKLHPLKGELNGYWSIRVSRNWRIIFRFHNGDVFDVDLLDYH